MSDQLELASERPRDHLLPFGRGSVDSLTADRFHRETWCPTRPNGILMLALETDRLRNQQPLPERNLETEPFVDET